VCVCVYGGGVLSQRPGTFFLNLSLIQFLGPIIITIILSESYTFVLIFGTKRIMKQANYYIWIVVVVVVIIIKRIDRSP
jgi:uncharacterized Tic20 family protein